VIAVGSDVTVASQIILIVVRRFGGVHGQSSPSVYTRLTPDSVPFSGWIAGKMDSVFPPKTFGGNFVR
jgi:hypothetical protein